jgi:hypothetical protein
MTKITFHEMNELRHEAEVLAIMRAPYVEDASSSVDPSRFPTTIEFLIAPPSRDRIILFSQGESICGYALLILWVANSRLVRFVAVLAGSDFSI